MPPPKNPWSERPPPPLPSYPPAAADPDITEAGRWFLVSLAGRASMRIRGRFIVGSSTSCDLSLNEWGIAPHHALLTLENDHLYIEPLSDGATWVNSKPLRARTRLDANSALSFGELEFGIEHEVQGSPAGRRSTLDPTERILPPLEPVAGAASASGPLKKKPSTRSVTAAPLALGMAVPLTLFALWFYRADEWPARFANDDESVATAPADPLETVPAVAAPSGPNELNVVEGATEQQVPTAVVPEVPNELPARAPEAVAAQTPAETSAPAPTTVSAEVPPKTSEEGVAAAGSVAAVPPPVTIETPTLPEAETSPPVPDPDEPPTEALAQQPAPAAELPSPEAEQPSLETQPQEQSIAEAPPTNAEVPDADSAKPRADKVPLAEPEVPRVDRGPPLIFAAREPAVVIDLASLAKADGRPKPPWSVQPWSAPRRDLGPPLIFNRPVVELVDIEALKAAQPRVNPPWSDLPPLLAAVAANAGENVVEALLVEADRLYSQGDLVTPPHESAADIYVHVLQLSPKTRIARTRLDNIVGWVALDVSDLLASRRVADANRTLARLSDAVPKGQRAAVDAKSMRRWRVAELLLSADALIQKRRIAGPAKPNAVAQLREALKIDRHNAIAEEMLARALGMVAAAPRVSHVGD